jgi:uncharacterized BrkB/YihY/UPF0761 family membrane protein
MFDSDDRSKARLYRTLSILLGLVALFTALFFYMGLQMAGFPDGHLTDLDKAEKKFHPYFIALSVACGLYLIYIALTATSRGIGKKFAGGAVAYLLMLGVTLAIEFYLSQTLDDGIGG